MKIFPSEIEESDSVQILVGILTPHSLSPSGFSLSCHCSFTAVIKWKFMCDFSVWRSGIISRHITAQPAEMGKQTVRYRKTVFVCLLIGAIVALDCSVFRNYNHWFYLGSKWTGIRLFNLSRGLDIATIFSALLWCTSGFSAKCLDFYLVITVGVWGFCDPCFRLVALFIRRKAMKVLSLSHRHITVTLSQMNLILCWEKSYYLCFMSG